MNFKIDNGPWQTIFQGSFYDHKIEIVKNPEFYYLLFIYDTKNNQDIGALVEGYKAFVAKGQMETFVQTCPKPCFSLAKTDGVNTHKILCLSFDPVYVDFKAEDFIRKVDNKLKESYYTFSTIIELARSSSLDLVDLTNSSQKEYSSIIGDPLMAQSLISGLKRTALEMVHVEGNYSKSSSLTLQLGLTKKREKIKESMDDLKRTLIIGENENSLNYASYILAENFLLDNKNIIVFDSTNSFDGLSKPSKNEIALKDELMDYEPSGFPIKKFIVNDNLKVSFNSVNLNVIFDLLKINDQNLVNSLNETKKQFLANTPIEFSEKIKQTDLDEFLKLKTQRLMVIFEQQFGKSFGNNIDSNELIKKWPGNLGRASIIDTSKLNENQRILVEQTLISYLDESIKNQVIDDLVIFLNHGDQILSVQNKSIVSNILNLENSGLGFVIASKEPLNSLQSNLNAMITIIDKKDVAISLKNKRSYRLNLRPTLSGIIDIK
ncbi:MAG: hypothetical protein PHQ98_03300 [Candidatus ainarchaeum sp.]|nr:hypothetical protein [Candidatus ainarchaeum sp.]